MAACEKRAKSEAGDEVDRISALPIHLRESILECLPIQDAMKTCILSRKWRYSWTGLRILNLGNYRYDGRIEVFRRAIDRILLLHSGPLRKCDIRIPMNGNVSNINLADWVYALAKNGIQELSIDAFAIVDPFHIPSSLFDCQDLKRLNLNHIKLKQAPHYLGFRNLVYLEINFGEVPLHVLGNLISQSPFLEEVSLHQTCGEYDMHPLVINALNLRTLIFEDVCGAIIFKNVPRLNYVSLVASLLEVGELVFGRPWSSWEILYPLIGIKELVFDFILLGPVIRNVPKCFPTKFENLNTLTLASVSTYIEDDMRLVLCVIRSSPVLQDLTIIFAISKSEMLQVPKKSQEAAYTLLATETREQCKLSKLSTMKLGYFEGLSHDIMFVKIMLSRCPNLKSLKLGPAYGKTSDDVIKKVSREFDKLPNKDKLIYSNK